MSAIHRALSDTGPRQPATQSDFNPLQPRPSASRRYWWWLILVLVIIIAVLSSLRFRTVLTPGKPSTVELAATTVPQTAAAEPSLPLLPPAAEVAPPVETERVPPAKEPRLSESEITVAEPSAELAPQTATSEPEQPGEPEPRIEPEPPTDPGNEAPPPEQRTPEVVPTPVASQPEQPEGQSENNTSAETTPQTTRDIVTPTAPGLEDRIKSAIADQNLAQARQLLRQWMDAEPTNDVPRVWLARILLADNQLDQSMTLLQGLNSIQARALIGLVHERKGEYQRAAALYETLAGEEPSNAQWWLRWAINLENSDQLAQARNLYQTYLQVFSGHDSSLARFAQQRYQALEGY